MVRFAAFLREAEAVEDKTHQRWLDWLFGGVVAVVFTGLIWLVKEVGSYFGCLFFIVPFAIAAYLRDLAKKRLDRQRDQSDALQAHYIEMIREFTRYSSQGTLNERIHPALAPQLESAATSYFQVKEWLASKGSVNVLGSETHREVQRSIRKAMREVVFALHGQYRPTGMQRKKWDAMVASDPGAIEASEDLARVCGLILQLGEIAKKTESLGKTITLMDQLEAVRQAISELEETSYNTIKALPPRKT